MIVCYREKISACLSIDLIEADKEEDAADTETTTVSRPKDKETDQVLNRSFLTQ